MHSYTPAAKRGHKQEAWVAFLRKWWGICLQTEEQSHDTFTDEWRALLALLPEAPAEDAPTRKQHDDALKWLERLGNKREQWAARWTWAAATFGVHSTQRAESVHSAIKKWLAAHNMLVHLADQLLSYREEVSIKATAASVRLALRQASPNQMESAILSWCVKNITPYAVDIIKGQLNQVQEVLLYSGEEVDAGDAEQPVEVVLHTSTDARGEVRVEVDVFQRRTWLVKRVEMPQSDDGEWRMQTVKGDSAMIDTTADDYGLPASTKMNFYERRRVTTLRRCTCQFCTSYQLPCRHMLWVYHRMGVHALVLGVVGDRWRLRTPEEVSVMVERMRVTPTAPAVSQTVGQGAARVCASLTREERYRGAMADARSLAEVASTSMETYTTWKSEVSKVLAVMRTGGRGGRGGRRGRDAGSHGAARGGKGGRGGAGARGRGPPVGQRGGGGGAVGGAGPGRGLAGQSGDDGAGRGAGSAAGGGGGGDGDDGDRWVEFKMNDMAAMTAAGVGASTAAVVAAGPTGRGTASEDMAEAAAAPLPPVLEHEGIVSNPKVATAVGRPKVARIRTQGSTAPRSSKRQRK